MTLIAPGTLGVANHSVEGIYRATNDALWCIFDNGGPKYSVSTDAGATWSAPAALGSGMPTGTDTIYAAVNEPGTDTVFFVTPDAIDGARFGKLTFSTAGSTVAVTQYGTFGSDGGTMVLDAASAAWDATSGLWHVFLQFTQFGGAIRTYLLALNTSGAVQVAKEMTASGTTGPFHVTVKPGTAEVYVGEAGISYLTIIPLLYSGGYTASPVAELVSGVAVADFILSWDSSNRLDIVGWNNPNLFALKRTAGNTYSPATPLYGGADLPYTVFASGLAWAADSGTGDLVVLFATDVNFPNGEIYAVRRKSGTWQPVQVFSGGDNTGYIVSSAFHVVSGSSTPVVVQTLGGNILYGPGGLTLASAPNKPVVSSPSGTVATLTPTLSAPYSNSTPGDPQKSYQWQVEQPASTSKWDTGEVASALTSITYAGSALSYGTAGRARVRYKDSLSAASAGTWSPWSDWSTFTPLRGPVPVLTKITSGGTAHTVFPTTIGSPSIAIEGTCTQPDGDSFNRAQVRLYGADNTTLLRSGTPLTLSPVVPSGGTIDVPAESFLSLMTNGDDYYFALAVTDATNNLVGESAHVKVTAAWTPPAAPDHLEWEPDDDSGTVYLSWTVDGDTTAVRVEMEFEEGPMAGQIETYSFDTPITERTVVPNATISTTLRVVAINALGLEASSEIQAVVIGLRGAGDECGIWFTDADNPSDSVALGVPQNADSLQWQVMDNAEEFVPMGESFPKTWFDLTGYHYTPNAVVWTILPSYALKDGGFDDGAATVAMFEKWAKSHPILLYRDINGNRWLCQLRQILIPILTSGEWNLSWVAEEKKPRTDGVSY